jgi:hypothetical protein
MTIFDYIFYRIAKFFYRRDGIDAFRAIAIVALMQTLFLAEIATLILRSMFSKEEIAKYALPIKSSYLGMVVVILFLSLNFFKYRKTYWKFSEKWKDKETPMQHEVRGYLVLLSIFAPIILLVLMGTIF